MKDIIYLIGCYAAGWLLFKAAEGIWAEWQRPPPDPKLKNMSAREIMDQAIAKYQSERKDQPPS